MVLLPVPRHRSTTQDADQPVVKTVVVLIVVRSQYRSHESLLGDVAASTPADTLRDILVWTEDGPLAALEL